MPTPKAVIFGPQRTFPGPESLTKLRLVLLGYPALVAAIKTLPDLWQILLKALPELNQVPGPRVFHELSLWIADGRHPSRLKPLPNVLLTPLSIVSDILNYLHYIKLQAFEENKHTDDILSSMREGCTFHGRCTGLLAAVVFAYSKQESDAGILGAVALRLAVCIGALVDLEGAFAVPPDEACCLSVHYGLHGKSAIEHILEDFPGAYVSVTIDENCATITSSRASVPSLTQRLTSQGLTVQLSATEGRFHFQKHQSPLDRILEVCENHPNLTFAIAQDITAPRSVSLGFPSSDLSRVHKAVLKSILIERSDWLSAMLDVVESLRYSTGDIVLAIGNVKINSHSRLHLKEHDCSIKILEDFEACHSPERNSPAEDSSDLSGQSQILGSSKHSCDNDIAIIGMSCRFPGADSIEEYWDLLCTGRSMHHVVPSDRYSANDLWRAKSSHRNPIFWGNFVNDIERFDHEFFKISSREAASMDPQQRMALELAYEAIESSGYFDESTKEKTVGCYIGVGSVDYENNAASHTTTAFSALGTQRAFITGRISHHFGWTGPSVVIDTACSSSSVAIHSACKAIQIGECSLALAGGVNVMTSAILHQNLSKAGFLSPSGPCRSFDAQADGYCRGEGSGMLVLKRLTSAIIDGDPIAGVIAASGVSQSDNSSPITVPQSQSQRDLFQKVTALARIHPHQVDYVEAHGTGTPVGDPIELETIKTVFGDPQRSRILHVGSVKSTIGHLEAASGVAAVIKAVLMTQKGSLPAQVNFSKINPKIKSLEQYKIEISTITQDWDGSIICVNNYGAAGSNASIIIRKHPATPFSIADQVNSIPVLQRYPVFLSGKSESSLRARCAAIDRRLAKESISNDPHFEAANIAFEIAHRADRHLPLSTTTYIGNSTSKGTKLLEIEEPRTSLVHEHVRAKTTVLCFGGQTGSTIGLDRNFIQEIAIVRTHLNNCASICRSLGVEDFYPKIFSSTPVEDLVLLHCMLFSIQYACAMSWLDCGLHVDLLIGHSFGQLTALCVSGSISLRQALTFIKGRATLIKTEWGPDKGAMLHVNATVNDLQNRLSSMGQEGFPTAEIACFNGTKSQVLAGSTASIEHLQRCIGEHGPSAQPIKTQRLNVTHGFHSQLVEPVMPKLAELAATIDFQKPQIPVETCSHGQSWTCIDARSVAQHSRDPVYFAESVDRIVQQRGLCSFIEAGIGSGIIDMVRGALGATRSLEHNLQDVPLTCENSLLSLADATVNLWRSGLKTQFWMYHRLQKPLQADILLPPYQFDKEKHWLPHKNLAILGDSRTIQSPALLQLISFLRPQNARRSAAEFGINPESDEFKSYLEGHKVLGKSICPASVYIYLVVNAVSQLSKNGNVDTLPDVLAIENLEMHSPLTLDPQRLIILNLESSDHSPHKWTFHIISFSQTVDSESRVHAKGYINTENAEILADPLEPKTSQLLPIQGPVTSIQGALIYQVFSGVVAYEEYMRGMQEVSIRDAEIIGQVSLPEKPARFTRDAENMVCDPVSMDNFLQVAGLYINCLRDHEPGLVYVCTRTKTYQLHINFGKTRPRQWKVVCKIASESGTDIVCDICVVNSKTEATVIMISGIHFTGVPIESLKRSLSNRSPIQSSNSGKRIPNLTKAGGQATGIEASALTPASNVSNYEASAEGVIGSEDSTAQTEPPHGSADNVAFSKLQDLISDITEVSIEKLDRSSSLEAIGIDSLMATEVLEEIEKKFGIDVTLSDFDRMKTLDSLFNYINSRGSKVPYVAPRIRLMYAKTKESDKDCPSLATIEGEPHTMSHSSDTKNNTRSTLAESLASKTSGVNFLRTVLQCFGVVQKDFDRIAEENYLKHFSTIVYPQQAKLVVAYAVKALKELGCSLSDMQEGDTVEIGSALNRKKLEMQMFHILEEAALIHIQQGTVTRSGAAVEQKSVQEIFHHLMQVYPKHDHEHKLLAQMGPCLGRCLSGKDSLQVMFGNREARELLKDVYTQSPLFATGTHLLSHFLSNFLPSVKYPHTMKILEVGGGVGGTTVQMIKLLEGLNVPFAFTFTDISSSLVAAAKKKFAGHGSMSFQVLDIENDPGDSLSNSQDIVISTNTIHATKCLQESCSNLRKLLKEDGVLCLVELTRNLSTFDLVFGQLDGWWRSEDGRSHPIAEVERWERDLQEAGFENVRWTGADHNEGDLIRLIMATAPDLSIRPDLSDENQIAMETIMFKQVGRIPLYADIYYPEKTRDTKSLWPIALLVHGGGHVMLSRKDLRPLQIEHLLRSGVLPIAIDHRLCPELSILDGPMSDVCHAYNWARNLLPHARLQRSDISPDGTRVVVIGWSTGGMLAMSLGWTAPARGLKPPDAILAFYCPTDYQAEWWKQPHFPWRTSQADADRKYNVEEAVSETPLTGYNIASARAPGGWMSTLDPRARIPLHMNWTAQTLPILLGSLSGEREMSHDDRLRNLPSARFSNGGNVVFPQPPDAAVEAISPLAQIRAGNYLTPTYLVHGSDDDFIPWQQSQVTYDELRSLNIDAGISIVTGGGHMFEMLNVPKGDERVWQAVLNGYNFLFERINLPASERSVV